jgi:imidazolonepropionase-like amidohydrolase
LLLALTARSVGAQTAVGGSDQGVFAIRNARIFTVSGPIIENGTLIIQRGLIAAIGADVAVPPGAKVIDATGLSVYPGMIDAGTNLGLIEIGQGANATVDATEVGALNPAALASVALNPHSAHVEVTRVVGVTNVLAMPVGGLISGQAAFVNLLGYTPAEMAIVAKAGMVVTLPGSGSPDRGGTVGGSGSQTAMEDLRRMLRDAAAYGNAHDAYARDASLPRPASDNRLASLVPAVRGEMPVFFQANSAPQIRSALDFAHEFSLRPVIVGGGEAWKVAEIINRASAPVIYTGILGVPGVSDAFDLNFSAPGRMAAAGLKFSISTGSDGSSVRDLPYHAGMAAAFGLPKDAALRAVTLAPAQLLGVSDRLGSLEVGKIANVVVTDGDLLEARTTTKYLFIDGRQVPVTSKHEQLFDMFRSRGVIIIP